MGYAVFKMGSCSFHVSKKMDQEGESQVQSFILVLVSNKTRADLSAAEEAPMSFSQVLDSH